MTVSRENNSAWDVLIETVSSSEYFRYLFSKKPVALKSLPDGFLSLLLSAYVTKKKGAVIVIADDLDSENFYLTLSDLLPDLIHYAPKKQAVTDASSVFITEDEKQFADAYNFLETGGRGLLVVAKSALGRQVRSPFEKNNMEYLLETNSKSNIAALLRSLSVWGYEKKTETVTPKTFCVRGGILDIYPLYSKYPVRIETFGDLVESVRLFNPVSQLSIKTINDFKIVAPSGFFSNNMVSLQVLFKGIEDVFYLKRSEKVFRISNSTNAVVKEIKFNGSCVDKNAPARKSKKTYVFTSKKSIGKKLKMSLGGFLIIEKPLPSGFFSNDLNLVVYGYTDLNIQRPSSGGDLSLTPETNERFTLSNIEWGDLVVHENYGIGLYRGLAKKTDVDNQQDFIAIEYADGGIVNVPVDRFDIVHKYISAHKDSIKLSRLGSKLWSKQKSIIHKSAELIVDDLVAIYSSKQAKRSFSYSSDNELVELLAGSFPFEETPDQQKAIHDVLEDLDKASPMDRVIFGDVGFGKTEVALRGAIKAIAGGRQVFFLAPTTLLADQHYITCENRLSELGVNVALLSRFQTKKEQLEIINQIETKKVDIIVGTHRLLSDDIVVNNLGLLIIDEEHRFGVKHKERIRILKQDVDVLTLTATPIPRTLQQSLFGVRNVSRINTPPMERLPIKTIIGYFNWKKIKEQVGRELRRGGQIYFLHNDINSIPFVVDKLRDLFPNHSSVGAHGSIPSKNLEKIILSFFYGEIDILVCTTIIESGLDVTRANTIIINNAHRFGIAQLYQIRGRVGRGNVQAYCWLLIPHKTLKKEAYERLRAIEHFSALGSGYQIALKDLEIRGAGNLFGYEQSGNIGKVGFHLYCKILNKALDEKLKGSGFKKVTRPTVSIKRGAFFSEEYIPIVQDRIYYYQRLASAVNTDEVFAVKYEVLDRYGKMSEEADNVINAAYLRELFLNLGVEKILLDTRLVRFDFSNQPAGGGINFSELYNDLLSRKWNCSFKEHNKGFSLVVNTDSLIKSISFAKEINKLLKANFSG
ncbi:MAG: DEAD/DEAH box helicase [Fidelibacterota bacterium]